MKFVRENGTAGVTIPRAAMKLSHFDGAGKLELHALDSASVLLKEKMTAMELLNAVSSMDHLAGELLEALIEACDDCVGCEDDCPFSQENRDLRLPRHLLDVAEIPEGAKLRAEPDPDSGRIIVSAREVEHSLDDVPEDLLEVLTECGVCLEALDWLLGSGEIVYGA